MGILKGETFLMAIKVFRKKYRTDSHYAAIEIDPNIQ
jgi:hypothetical protein